MVAAAKQIPPRAEIDLHYKWNAESVFADLNAWNSEFEAVKAEVPKTAAYKGRLGESPAVLADWLEYSAQVARRAMKLYFYAAMTKECDSNDQQAAAMTGQATGLFGMLLGSGAFAQPEILTLGQEKVFSWTTSEPRLALFAHYFEDLFRQQQHVRSAEVEEILGMLADPFSGADEAFSALTNADIEFAPAVGSDGSSHEVAQSSINTLLDSADREVRRTAWENYSDAYLKFKNTLAATYTTSVKQDIFRARARGFSTALEATLFEPNIPLGVFHNLIETYRKNLPTWHKYWRVRRKALGVDTLHSYDVWAPIATNVAGIPYEQAVEWISTAMQPLGSEYAETLRKGCLEQRWVDVYPNQGKRKGAFSFGTYDTFPFIMMSYDDNLGAMSTLAHELGHSMHSYLTRKHQPYVYSNYSMFVAEVASNFNQAMTRAYLFEQKQDDPQFQIGLIEEAMSNFHRYFFIMPTLARFELEVHTRVEQGKAVTVDDLISIMADYFGEGYGDAMHLDRERDGITWAQFGHLYANYYTFQYATGISAAHALSADVLAGKPGAAENYVKFLSAGSALYPLEALKLAGVDMHTPEAVEKTFSILAEMVDRLDALTS